MQRSTVFNFILFQLAWLIAVWAAARGHGWLGPVTVGLWVMAFMAWHRPARKDTTLLIVTGLIGFFMDSILVWSGSIQFPEWAGPAFPTTVWMVALWVNLAASLRHSLKWLTGRYGLGIVFGAVGGPLAYLAGEKLNAIVVIELPVVVAAWAIAMPLILWAERITSGDTVVDASSVEPRERARES